MRILLQRVKNARVVVDRQEIAAIEKGFLLFVGIGKGDTDDDIAYLCKKVINLRVFEDGQGKMNLDIRQVGGQILSVSQFTLFADTRKGNRPGFDKAAAPLTAENYWRDFNKLLSESGIDVREGIFGAHMEIDLINDGPVTILLDSRQHSE